MSELKPVNENCLFKSVLFSDDENTWKEHILLGHLKRDGFRWQATYKATDQVFGFIHSSSFLHAKRCPDVIYGDEDDRA